MTSRVVWVLPLDAGPGHHRGVTHSTEVSPSRSGRIPLLALVLGAAVAVLLGVVMRNSAAAIVTYFTYWFVIPTLSMVLAANQAWFEKAQPWVDFNYNQGMLYDGGFTAQNWLQLAVTGAVWLVLPLAFGLWRVMRAEVK